MTSTMSLAHRLRPQSIVALLAVCFCILQFLWIVFPRPGYAGEKSATGSFEQGKQLFTKRCGGCHALDEDREGPRLHNVYGRKAGNIATFQYSGALKASTVVWNEATLDKWLTDTDSLVPDNDMTFHVPNAQERADIIHFLRVSSGQ